MALTFPANWGQGAREGLVVEFQRSNESVWVGNFAPGLGGIDEVLAHPNGADVLVVSSGDLWRVNPRTQDAIWLASAVFGSWVISGPPRLVFSDQDVAFLCVGAEALLWATPRISWDGFRGIQVDHEVLRGEAWSPVDDNWSFFRVKLADGSVVGGSYTGPEMTWDLEDLKRKLV